MKCGSRVIGEAQRYKKENDDRGPKTCEETEFIQNSLHERSERVTCWSSWYFVYPGKELENKALDRRTMHAYRYGTWSQLSRQHEEWFLRSR